MPLAGGTAHTIRNESDRDADAKAGPLAIQYFPVLDNIGRVIQTTSYGLTGLTEQAY